MGVFYHPHLPESETMKHYYLFLLLFVIGCAPVGKIIDPIQPQIAAGPSTPVGKVITIQSQIAVGPSTPVGSYASPGTKLVFSPSTLSFLLSDTTKTMTVTATDKFIHQKIFLCKTPCTSLSDWKEVGSFDGTPVIGTYLGGTTGISKQLALSRDDLMDGNNFIVVFTCAGIGLCNGNRWLSHSFTATFERPPTCTDDGSMPNGQETDVDCGGPDCQPCADGLKCNQATDCQSGVCSGTPKTCAAPRCDDTVKNGQEETDVDCGGSCPKCGVDKNCKINADCTTNKCTNEKCAGLPDLIVSAIKYIGPNGNNMDVQFDLQNIGLVEATLPLAVMYTVTDTQTNAVKKTETLQLQEVPPKVSVGSSTASSVTITVPLGTSLKLSTEAEIDPSHAVAEMSETNNKKTATYDGSLITPPPPGT